MHIRRGPMVSVLMPVRNGARWLEDAARSILTQSLGDLELVIVDDGSDDATVTIIAALIASDSRVRTASTGGTGLVAALNLGLTMAHAELVARMDADDIAEPQRLEMQSAAMRRDPRLTALGGAVLFIDESGRTIGRNRPLRGEAAVSGLAGGPTIAHPTAMLRRNAVLAAGGYRAWFPHAEDLDLWLRLAAPGALDNLPEVVLRYRMHDRSVSAQNAYAQAAAAALALACSRIRRRTGYDPAAAGCSLETMALTEEERGEALALLLARTGHLALAPAAERQRQRQVRRAHAAAGDPGVRTRLADHHIGHARLLAAQHNPRALGAACLAMATDPAAILAHLTAAVTRRSPW